MKLKWLMEDMMYGEELQFRVNYRRWVGDVCGTVIFTANFTLLTTVYN